MVYVHYFQRYLQSIKLSLDFAMDLNSNLSEQKFSEAASQDRLGESPLWDHRRGLLFWVDIDNGIIHSLEPESKQILNYALHEKIGCLALAGERDFILATESGFYLWNPETNHKQLLLAVQLPDDRMLFNDGKIDPIGRFWIGSKGPQGMSGLWILKNNNLEEKIPNLSISNGLDWNVERGYFYHTDSAENTIYRYKIDPEFKNLSDKEAFFQTTMGTPDGMTLDTEGNIWTAIWDGWKVIQLNPEGKILTEIALPVQRPTSLAFGGKDFKSLFITSAFVGLSESERQSQASAGNLFMLKTSSSGSASKIFKILNSKINFAEFFNSFKIS